MKRGREDGFTLLEIMVAIAILSMTLVVLLSIVTNNVRATNHSKMTTAATLLARTKMVDLEDQVLDQGFIDTTDSASGTFKELGYPQFSWESVIERIELPSDMGQQAKDQAVTQQQDAKDPMSMLTGFMGGMMSSFIEPVRIGLQESVRKVTVRIYWNEHGRKEQSFELVQYLTDPSKLMLAVNPPGGNGTGGSSGSSGSGGSTGRSGITNPLQLIH